MHIKCTKCGHSEETDISLFVKLIGGAMPIGGFWAWTTYLFAGTGFALPIVIAIITGGIATLIFKDEIVEWIITKGYSCSECGAISWVEGDFAIEQETNKILANKVVKKTPPPPKVVHKISTDQNKAIEFSDNIEAWIDTDTGLMWEIKTKENIKHLYVWSKEEIQTALSPKNLTDDVKDAFSYAQKLNANNHAGFSNWRVPTIQELKTLTKEKNKDYYIKYPLSKNIIFNGYWSSVSSANDTNAWIVVLYNGGQGRNDKTNSYYVRCVRDNSGLSIELRANNAGITVKEQAVLDLEEAALTLAQRRAIRKLRVAQMTADLIKDDVK